MDREKVIRALDTCANTACCAGCGYVSSAGVGYDGCMDSLMRDALALLKAQEPNEDWISRKRLKDEIQYYIDEAGWGDNANKVLGWCLEFIDNQRAVKWE